MGGHRECVKETVKVVPSAIYMLTKTKVQMSLSVWEADGISVTAFQSHAPLTQCQALSEAGQRLKVSDQDATSLRTEVQRLSSALAEADAQRRTWSSDAERMKQELAQYQEEVSCPSHSPAGPLLAGHHC